MTINKEEWIKSKIKEYENIANEFNYKAEKEMIIEHNDFESYRDAYRAFSTYFVFSIFLSLMLILASSFFLLFIGDVEMYTSSTQGNVELITNKYER